MQITNLSQRLHFGLQDLQRMNIGIPQRNKIWRALVEFRNTTALHPMALHSTGDLQPYRGSSAAGSSSAIGLDPSDVVAGAYQRRSEAGSSAVVDGGGYEQVFYDVSRCTFRHTVSLKEEDDHNYC